MRIDPHTATLREPCPRIRTEVGLSPFWTEVNQTETMQRPWAGPVYLFNPGALQI